MKMENMMYNIYDYPELFKEMMDRIAEDTLSYYRFWKKNNLILPTVGGQGLGQGSWCYNHELPGEAEAKKSACWFQRTSGASWIPRKQLDFRRRCMRNLFSVL